MKIVFLEPLGLKTSIIEEACAGLKQQGHEVVIYPDRNENLDELIRRAQGAEVVIESNIPLRKNFLDACPKLKMLSIAFTGLDHIDMEECQRRGILVKNAAGYSTEAVAELAIAMMIDVYRKVLENDRITRECQRKGIMPGREIGGKTVGIIGMGNIGQRVAKLLNAFGCKVLAWNRTPKTVEGVTFVDKETLLKESDIVTLHIALNNETRDFITERELKLMKPSAILINTARGPVVNEQALAVALKSGIIAGAATVQATNEELAELAGELESTAFSEDEIDLSTKIAAGNYGFWGGVWRSDPAHSGWFIPISGESIRVVAGNGLVYCMFCSGTTQTARTASSYVSGPFLIQSGDTWTYDIPQNATYLWCNINANDNRVLPSEVYCTRPYDLNSYSQKVEPKISSGSILPL